MKDSAVRTCGVLGLVLTLLLRWRTLVAIEPECTLLACVLSQTLPRAASSRWRSGPVPGSEDPAVHSPLVCGFDTS